MKTTLSALFARTPQATETNLWELLNSRLLEEASGVSYAWGVESPRVRIDVLLSHTFDERRTWELAVVRFDGEPVMLTQRAGREGRDLVRRLVVSRARLVALVQHVVTLGDPAMSDPEIDVNEEREDLASFFGFTLDGPFDRW